MDTFTNQQRAIYNLLSGQDYPEGLTRLQIAYKLGIERATICRRVFELMEAGLMWVVKKDLDPLTATRAEFLTCSRSIAMTRKPEAKELSGSLF